MENTESFPNVVYFFFLLSSRSLPPIFIFLVAHFLVSFFFSLYWMWCVHIDFIYRKWKRSTEKKNTISCVSVYVRASYNQYFCCFTAGHSLPDADFALSSFLDSGASFWLPIWPNISFHLAKQIQRIRTFTGTTKWEIILLLLFRFPMLIKT